MDDRPGGPPEPEAGSGSERDRGTPPAGRLRRSRSDRVLGGVFGGLGPYLGIDPVVLRVAWVALTVLSFGTGIVAYAVAWIVIPETRDEEGLRETGEVDRDAGRLVIGTVLLVLGLFLLARETFPDLVDLALVRRALVEAGDIAGALILIALGVAVLVVGARRR